jgi:UDP-N-acetylglucosamine transferase subunit ALG13
VTVGTTKFDALIGAVDTEAVAAALADHGYDRLIMQVGAWQDVASLNQSPGPKCALQEQPASPHHSC